MIDFLGQFWFLPQSQGSETIVRRLETNPYMNRGAIRKPEDFFGRTLELQEIYKRLLGGQSISLVGERRIGKSSLLNAVGFQREEYDFPGEFHFVFVDMQSIADCTEESFLEFLAYLIAEETEQPKEGMGRAALWKMAEQLKNRNERLVVLLDELEVLMNSKQISPALATFLRSWLSQCGVLMVAAFRQGSIDQIVEDVKHGSPLLNIFGSVYVGPFERDEALDLVRIPAESCGIVFSDEEVREIFELSGYFPLFLQITCYHMLDLRQSGRIRSDWQEELEDRFTLEAKPHFEYLWGRLSQAEQAAVQGLCKEGKVKELRRDVGKVLQQKGIVISDGGEERVFSRVFKSFVLCQPAIGKVEEGITQSVIKGLFG